MARTNFGDSIFVPGDITFSGNLVPGVSRADITQQDLQECAVPFTTMRIHDNLSGLLPATAAADDLGISGTPFGTASPYLLTADAQSTSVTAYARWQFPLPVEYTSGQSVRVAVHCGMLTTVADTSALIDVSAFESDDDGAVGSELVTTAAVSCNSLTLSEFQFVLTSTDLAPGDVLDCRVSMALVDAATSSAVLGKIGRVSMRLDVRG